MDIEEEYKEIKKCVDDGNKGKLINIYLEHNKYDRTDKEINEVLKAGNSNYKNILSGIHADIKEMVRYYTARGYASYDKKYALTSSLCIGLGDPSTHDHNIQLDYTYGVPYIPASAIKGALRHYCQEQAGLDKKELEEIFGNQSKQGKIIIFDAYPLDKFSFRKDVICNHYPNYYKDGKFVDTENPNPISFSTVVDTTFHIRWCTDQGITGDSQKWLKEVLVEMGLGAKKNVGYGRFEEMR